MSRFAVLGALCLLLGGCVYAPPYGYAPQPRYRYAPAYAYPAPPPAYPYAPGPYAPGQPYAAPRAASGMPQTLGPNGDTSGATGSN